MGIRGDGRTGSDDEDGDGEAVEYISHLDVESVRLGCIRELQGWRESQVIPSAMAISRDECSKEMLLPSGDDRSLVVEAQETAWWPPALQLLKSRTAASAGTARAHLAVLGNATAMTEP